MPPVCVEVLPEVGMYGRMDSQSGDMSSIYGRRLLDGVRLCVNILNLMHTRRV